MAIEEKIPVFGKGMRNTGKLGASLKNKHSKMGKEFGGKGVSPGKGVAPVGPIKNPGVPAPPKKKP